MNSLSKFYEKSIQEIEEFVKRLRRTTHDIRQISKKKIFRLLKIIIKKKVSVKKSYLEKFVTDAISQPK